MHVSFSQCSGDGDLWSLISCGCWLSVLAEYGRPERAACEELSRRYRYITAARGDLIPKRPRTRQVRPEKT